MISILFGVSESTVETLFYSLAFHHFAFANFTPRLWTNENLTTEAKNPAYQTIYDTQDPFYKKVGSLFHDPKKMDRKCVILAIDSTKIQVGIQFGSKFI